MQSISAFSCFSKIADFLLKNAGVSRTEGCVTWFMYFISYHPFKIDAKISMSSLKCGKGGCAIAESGNIAQNVSCSIAVCWCGWGRGQMNSLEERFPWGAEELEETMCYYVFWLECKVQTILNVSRKYSASNS